MIYKPEFKHNMNGTNIYYDSGRGQIIHDTSRPNRHYYMKVTLYGNKKEGERIEAIETNLEVLLGGRGLSDAKRKVEKEFRFRNLKIDMEKFDILPVIEAQH